MLALNRQDAILRYCPNTYQYKLSLLVIVSTPGWLSEYHSLKNISNLYGTLSDAAFKITTTPKKTTVAEFLQSNTDFVFQSQDFGGKFFPIHSH